MSTVEVIGGGTVEGARGKLSGFRSMRKSHGAVGLALDKDVGAAHLDR